MSFTIKAKAIGFTMLLEYALTHNNTFEEDGHATSFSDFETATNRYKEIDADFLLNDNFDTESVTVYLYMGDKELTSKKIFLKEDAFVSANDYDDKSGQFDSEPDLYIRVRGCEPVKIADGVLGYTGLMDCVEAVSNSVRELNKHSYNNTSYELLVKR